MDAIEFTDKLLKTCFIDLRHVATLLREALMAADRDNPGMIVGKQLENVKYTFLPVKNDEDNVPYTATFRRNEGAIVVKFEGFIVAIFPEKETSNDTPRPHDHEGTPV